MRNYFIIFTILVLSSLIFTTPIQAADDDDIVFLYPEYNPLYQQGSSTGLIVEQQKEMAVQPSLPALVPVPDGILLADDDDIVFLVPEYVPGEKADDDDIVFLYPEYNPLFQAGHYEWISFLGNKADLGCKVTKADDDDIIFLVPKSLSGEVKATDYIFGVMNSACCCK
jgi:hypothetical protein